MEKDTNQAAMRRRLEDLQKVIENAIYFNEHANISGVSLKLEEAAKIASDGEKITDRVLFSGPEGKMIDTLKQKNLWTE